MTWSRLKTINRCKRHLVNQFFLFFLQFISFVFHFLFLFFLFFIDSSFPLLSFSFFNLLSFFHLFRSFFFPFLFLFTLRLSFFHLFMFTFFHFFFLLFFFSFLFFHFLLFPLSPFLSLLSLVVPLFECCLNRQCSARSPDPLRWKHTLHPNICLGGLRVNLFCPSFRS